MASLKSALGVDVSRPSVSLSPYLEVVTGEAQLKLGLTAYALRAGKSELRALSPTLAVSTPCIYCRNEGLNKATTPDIPLDELLSRVMPL